MKDLTWLMTISSSAVTLAASAASTLATAPVIFFAAMSVCASLSVRFGPKAVIVNPGRNQNSFAGTAQPLRRLRSRFLVIYPRTARTD